MAVQYEGAVNRHPISYDLVCPHHSYEPSTMQPGAAGCILLMNEVTSGGSAVQQDALLNNMSTSCVLWVLGAPPMPPAQWAGPSYAASCYTTTWGDTAQVSVLDVRYLNNGSWTPGWVSSLSRSFPFSNANTAIVHAVNGYFTTPVRDLKTLDIPYGTGSKADWGGLSCDFVEFSKRLACVQLKSAW